jgi:transketolase
MATPRCLLYAILHLSGVKAVNGKYERLGEPAVSLDDIKRFRQIGSKCPGHPEYHLTSGVETTTGPLGQGCGNGVGMALAGRWLAKHFNRPDFTMFDYDVYAVCGDGDMMEGVSSEAASFAGHQMLGNLCWIYDSNRVTIEGHTDLAFSDDVAARFLAYGWNVQHVGDANDQERLAQAIEIFRRTDDAPTSSSSTAILAMARRTSMTPAQPTASRSARRRYVSPSGATAGPRTPNSWYPDGVREHFRDGMGQRGQSLHKAWLTLFESYRKKYPDLADEIERMQRREHPDGWDAGLPVFAADAKGLATRDSSGKVLNAIASHYPWLIGGAADLAPSTKTRLTFEGAGDLEADKPGGRNLHFGIREHAMGAILNGLALSKIRSFGSTFLIFSDYMKPPIRLSALMELPGRLCLHARFDRPRAGRPDAPTSRAAHRAAQHSRTHHAAAC